MITSKIADAHLIEQYRNGKQASFEELLNRYKNKVYTTIYLIVKDRYIAEDLSQEVFIKVVNRITSESYVEEGKFGGWVSRIAHNIAIDYFRKKKRNPEITLEDGTNVFNSMEFTEESIESVRIQKDSHTKLRSLVDSLPESQREVLVMRHYAEMSFKDIAESTGVSINTALGRMRYALINLRKLIEETNIAYDRNNYPT